MSIRGGRSQAPTECAPAESRREEADLTHWRDAREIQALREMIGIYRAAVSEFGVQITDLHSEVASLTGKLRRDRGARRVGDIDVAIPLDEQARRA